MGGIPKDEVMNGEGDRYQKGKIQESLLVTLNNIRLFNDSFL